MKARLQAWQGHTASVGDSVSCCATAIRRTSGAGGCRAPGIAAPKEPCVLQEMLLGLGKRRWAVMPQAAGCTIGTGTPLAAAGKALAATHLIGFFITSYDTHGLDEGVARVVDASLDALVQGPAIWGCLVTEPGVDGWRQVAGHAVVVLPQVGVLSTVGGDSSDFFGTRGLQHLCLCSIKTLAACMGWGAWGGVKHSAYPQQLGAGRQLQALQGKGRESPSPGLALNQAKSPQADPGQSLGRGSLSNTQQGPRVGEPAR